MKTWILIAASGSAAVCFYDSISRSTQVIRRIRERNYKSESCRNSASLDKFSKYLSEEMDIACGAGTDAKLVICAERWVLRRILKNLSIQAQSSILRTFGISQLIRIQKGKRIALNSQMLNRLELILQE